jgi:phosphohistidine phosphatase
MRKVILLRHAKSSWSDPAIDDHDRPLNRRGKAAAPLIGRWLAERCHVPDTVLCSSSRRTRQTVDRMRCSPLELPEPAIERELYHASPEQMLDRVRELPDDCRTVMLVGHNPGLGSLVRKMSDGRENRRCRRAYEHFPTGAAAVLEFDLDNWSNVDFGKARFVDFASPRELMEA